MSNNSNNFVLNIYELVWYKEIHGIVMNPELTYAYCLLLSKYFLFGTNFKFYSYQLFFFKGCLCLLFKQCIY